MDYKNNMYPAREQMDGENFHRVLADTTAGAPCGCTRRNTAQRNASSGRMTADDMSDMSAAELRGTRAERNDNGSADGCCRNEQANVAPLRGFPLSMVYAPNQEWRQLYEPEEALKQGTLFMELTYPWYPTACGRSCGCREGGAQ